MENNNNSLNNNRIPQWLQEPDFFSLQLEDFHVVIKRHTYFGALLGYVGIKRTHPYYGLDMRDVELFCHWGLSYSGNDLNGMENDYWYFGFDALHGGDFIPYNFFNSPLLDEALQKMQRELNQMIPEHIRGLFNANTLTGNDSNQYRNMEYMMEQITLIVEQLKLSTLNNPILERERKHELLVENMNKGIPSFPIYQHLETLIESAMHTLFKSEKRQDEK